MHLVQLFYIHSDQGKYEEEFVGYITDAILDQIHHAGLEHLEFFYLSMLYFMKNKII
jgi:hypothetical protein